MINPDAAPGKDAPAIDRKPDPRENWTNYQWDYFYLRTPQGQAELSDMMRALKEGATHGELPAVDPIITDK